MSDPDETMVRIGQGMEASQRGDRTMARSIFAEVWESIGADGDPFHRCALAHAMADVQDDPRDELLWDRRALDAADLVTDERAQAGGVGGSVQGFYPSLHLNLADVHLRLGDHRRAAHHVRLGQAALGALPDDGYRSMIEAALQRIGNQLDDATPADP